MFSLIWTNFTRKKGRLALTLLSLLTSFLLFGMLMAAQQTFAASQRCDTLATDDGDQEEGWQRHLGCHA